MYSLSLTTDHPLAKVWRQRDGWNPDHTPPRVNISAEVDVEAPEAPNATTVPEPPAEPAAEPEEEDAVPVDKGDDTTGAHTEVSERAGGGAAQLAHVRRVSPEP